MYFVFVSLEPWDEIWRRNQFFCAGLLKRHSEIRILFIEPPRNLSYAVRTGSWRNMMGDTNSKTEFGDRLICMKPLKVLPNSLTICRLFNEWFTQWQLGRLISKLKFGNPLLWINAHYAGHLVGHMRECLVIYDITDDWISCEVNARVSELIRIQDAELCLKADSVVVCSERLLELKKPMCDEVYLIPNAVDPDHYKPVLDDKNPLASETLGWESPVFGYTGTVHPERLDIDLVENLAARLERGSIVLVGPNYLSREQSARLRETGKVHLPGAVPYARIPDMMRAFAVCIVPHRMTAFTDSLNPIKLWEYLAAGKPIVSTDIAGFRDYRDVVSIARTPVDFFDAMQAALNEPAEKGFQRRQLVRGHSWENRIEMIEAVIEECLQRKRERPLHAL